MLDLALVLHAEHGGGSLNFYHSCGFFLWNGYHSAIAAALGSSKGPHVGVLY